MEQPTNQTTPAQPQRPGHRDMMFCHECADEWYRDERGLTCPECGSDFTEIIEENNDPRDSALADDDDDDDDYSMPDLADAPPHMHSAHNPWQSDDPEEADISNYHFTQTAPGRFNIQATITRSVSPQGLQGGPGSIGGFMSLLNGLVGTAVRPPGLDHAHEAHGSDRDQEQGNQSTFQESGNPPTNTPQVRTGHFTYHGGARLFPRDANGPQPHVEPVENIANVMTGLMAALGAPPGSINQYPHPLGGTQATFNGTHNPDAAHVQAHPFLQFFSSMGLMNPEGGSGQMGDFVYSQEGLDRIVSQLMEQTATSNAPGPATQSDIDSLPRRTVTEEMLGPEHTAECSICMDDVSVGEEVTVLPCKHWFHPQCITAWLVEHDTCPHCRKGISKREDGGGDEQTGSGARADRTSEMPGAFYSSSADAGNASSSSNQEGASGPNAGNAGGIGDRMFRGLFGPQ